MKTLKLDDKDALDLYKTAGAEMKTLLEKNWGKDFFNKKMIDQLDTVSDIFERLGLDEEEEIPFPKAKTAFQKYMNSCAIIPRLVQCLNEGVIMDFNNPNQTKYLPVFKKDNTGSGWSYVNYYNLWTSYANGPSSHHYKDVETLKAACKKFQSIYEDYYNGK